MESDAEPRLPYRRPTESSVPCTQGQVRRRHTTMATRQRTRAHSCVRTNVIRTRIVTMDALCEQEQAAEAVIKIHVIPSLYDPSSNRVSRHDAQLDANDSCSLEVACLQGCAVAVLRCAALHKAMLAVASRRVQALVSTSALRVDSSKTHSNTDNQTCGNVSVCARPIQRYNLLVHCTSDDVGHVRSNYLTSCRQTFGDLVQLQTQKHACSARVRTAM